jgi:hypothetical protein
LSQPCHFLLRCHKQLQSYSTQKFQFQETVSENSPTTHQHLHRYYSEADAALAIKPAKPYRLMWLLKMPSSIESWVSRRPPQTWRRIRFRCKTLEKEGSPPSIVCHVLP